MNQTTGFQLEIMLFTMLLWVCTVPIIGLVVVPWLGVKTAVIVALVLLPVFLAVCWGICGWYLIKKWFD